MPYIIFADRICFKGWSVMMKRNPFIFTFTLLTLFFHFYCSRQQSQWNGNIEEVNGVSVVYNPKQPIYRSDVLILEEDLNIGDENKEEDYKFGRIRAITTDDNENIYVLDGIECKVKKYDKNGNYILSFGRSDIMYVLDHLD